MNITQVLCLDCHLFRIRFASLYPCPRHTFPLTLSLPSSRIAHEKEVTSLSNQVLDAQRLRDVTDSALGQLKVKLKVTEEHRDRLEKELSELNRKLKDGKDGDGFRLFCYLEAECG